MWLQLLIRHYWLLFFTTNNWIQPVCAVFLCNKSPESNFKYANMVKSVALQHLTNPTKDNMEQMNSRTCVFWKRWPSFSFISTVLFPHTTLDRVHCLGSLIGLFAEVLQTAICQIIIIHGAVTSCEVSSMVVTCTGLSFVRSTGHIQEKKKPCQYKSFLLFYSALIWGR